MIQVTERHTDAANVQRVRANASHQLASPMLKYLQQVSNSRKVSFQVVLAREQGLELTRLTQAAALDPFGVM